VYLLARDAKYEGKREVRTFVDLAHGADVLISKTVQDEKGSYYTIMGSLILRAFSFEAYLNHLGSKHFEFWGEVEPIKVMSKYSILCKEFDIPLDFSRRPHQTLKALFKFRNAIAHGKSKILEKTKTVSFQDDFDIHSPKAEWEEFCSLDNAKRGKEDVSKIIEELHKAAGLGDHPFTSGLTVGGITLKPTNE